VLVAILIALIVLQIALLAVVRAGARDHDLTADRTQGARAFYAADSAAHMAVKEMVDNTDHDGDGGIGTISNDSNTATDPVLGATRMWATSTVAGSTTTITAHGENAGAVRAVQVAMSSGSTSSGAAVVYGDTTSNIPKFRTWSGSSWSSASSTLDIGGSPRWIVCRKCPTRDELIAACGDNGNDLNLMVYNGTGWGNLVEASTNLATSADRTFSMAYEQSSGNALVVYRVGSGSTVYYRTWNGTSWSSQSSTSISGSGDPKFIKLVPKSGSSEIMLLVLDSKKDLSAMVWNGSSFGNKVLLDSSTNSSGNEQFDAAYESSSGRCMVAWAVNGGGGPSYRVWSGSSWLTAGTMPDVGGKPNWIRLASDPASNKIIAMTLDTSRDVNAVVWSGSAWGSVTEFETNAPDTDRRSFDVAFEPAGTRALAMWSRSGQDTTYYRTYSGSAWSSESAGPDLTDPGSVVQMCPAASGSAIMIGVERKNDGAFLCMSWNGSSLSGLQTLATDLAGPNGNECFMLTPGAGASQPTITSWTAVQP
jgi:Tfp pilus assembly protein PilX